MVTKLDLQNKDTLTISVLTSLKEGEIAGYNLGLENGLLAANVSLGTIQN